MRALLALVLRDYRLPLQGTHGITHWGRVLENGRRLAPLTGADERVLEAFALLHDSKRRSEGRDPDHGPRAAAFALSIRDDIALDDPAFEQLLEACRCHTVGASESANVTVRTCLDADRLDIPRVGLRIKPELLFTPAGRDPALIRWASNRAADRIVPAVLHDEWGQALDPR